MFFTFLKFCKWHQIAHRITQCNSLNEFFCLFNYLNEIVLFYSILFYFICWYLINFTSITTNIVKGAPKLYFTRYSWVITILFNADLPVFFTHSFARDLIFHHSVFFLSILCFLSTLCFEFDVVKIHFILLALSMIYSDFIKAILLL